jgi:CspA family cold shock protein
MTGTPISLVISRQCRRYNGCAVTWCEARSPAKGFGFIEPEDGSKDAFIHISAVERAGLSSLSEGQKVSYELQPGQNGKSSAENLSVID